MQSLPTALAPLSDYRQFIVYRLVPRARKPGKMDKLPIDVRTLRVSDAHDPGVWLDAQGAIASAALLGDDHGVGFVFTAADPFWFLDIDDALQLDGTWSPLAQSLLDRTAGAAIEVSQSGKGLHVIGTGTAPPHGCRNDALGLEFYTSGRFVALTGAQASGSASADIGPALGALVAEFFPPTPASDPITAEWTDGPRPEWDGPDDDDELLARMLRTRSTASVFDSAPTVAALWEADPDALGERYPDSGGRGYDESAADLALAAHLAFWTGTDCERMERLMWRSGLAREKWTQHRTYLRNTILRAVAGCENVYSQGGRIDQDPLMKGDAVGEPVAPPAPPETVEPPVPVQDPADSNTGPVMAESMAYLPPASQMEYFTGCVYVQDVHRVFTPSGALLRPEQFKATYGGYVFSLDANNDKTTKNAWEAFVESQAVRWPWAEGMTFRPDLTTGAIVEEEGRKLVNVFMPINVPRLKGDPGPFLRHLAILLPDQRDQQIILAYMAACVQHAGVKFQWAPLIQGVEGNGKTLLTRCVAHAVGLKYSHFPKAEEVGSKFNSWLLNKLFIGIEDVYYPDHRREVVESLKPLITNEYLPIELKGVDQISARVCANFILNSNHRDAIRKTRNDRRFAVFYSAQQSERDLTRDGIDEASGYFPRLYDWLKKEGGYAIVAEFLATYDIPDQLNPAGECHRAPETSTLAEVLAESLGGVEQEILEAIDQGLPGFAGGWVSSRALDDLLHRLRKGGAIPPNKRRDLMRDLGYDWHPALRDGRVNNPIPLDGGKPKLFVHRDSPDRALQSCAEVVDAYTRAQQAGVSDAARVFSS